MQFEVYLKERVARDFERQALEFAQKHLETMILLLGRQFESEGKKWILVDDYINAKTDSTAVNVKFSHEAFPEIIRNFQQKKNGIIIGWAHSHPGYGCFLSATDINTQKTFFSQEFNIALVFDPLKIENGKMLKRAFKLSKNGYREASFAIIN